MGSGLRDRGRCVRGWLICLLMASARLIPRETIAQTGAATANSNASVGNAPGGAANGRTGGGAAATPGPGGVPSAVPVSPPPTAIGPPPAVGPGTPAAPRTDAPSLPTPTTPPPGPASILDPGGETPGTNVPQPGASAFESPPAPGPAPGAGSPFDGPLAYPIRQRRPGFFEVARESIFGPADYAPWTPLPLGTFFSEGWRDAWIAPPNGSGGAPRQGWIGAADGNFYRLAWISYIESFHTSGAPNGYTSRINIYTPLSRRLLLITTIPTVNANSPSFNLGTADFGSSGAAVNGQFKGTGTSFGDITITPRFMLKETKDLSLSMQLTVQIPTGRTGSGAGKAIVSPGIQFWRDIGRGWAIRGAVNAGTGTSNVSRGETIVSQLAIGQTITPHDMPIFGDFTYYLATNISNQVAPNSLTTVTLGPGYRTHLGNDWYSLGAITIPVTGPHPFDESLALWLMKTF